MTKVSIIIPVKEINDYILEFVPIILKQDFKDFEILILPDKFDKLNFAKTKVIATGHIGPAEKRDIGVKKSKGEIIAFIDDDAYPEKGWLSEAVKIFEDEKIGIVGGPNLTPEKSNRFQVVSGEALTSWLVSGPVAYRYKKVKRIESDDLPSCNLIIRKSLFKKIKGFDTSFWPGEDTKLCLDAKNEGYKIIYDPKVAVYHHRRPNIKGYLKQIGSYGLHRGFFAKRYPETSLKFSYFIPSIFLIGLIIGSIIGLMIKAVGIVYLIVLMLYVLLVFNEARKNSKFGNWFYFSLIVFLTHITYGLKFMNGLFRKSLKSKYR
ncbi:MAG: glycosyltransferase [Nanoarchaeota archaeon]